MEKPKRVIKEDLSRDDISLDFLISTDMVWVENNIEKVLSCIKNFQKDYYKSKIRYFDNQDLKKLAEFLVKIKLTTDSSLRSVSVNRIWQSVNPLLIDKMLQMKSTEPEVGFDLQDVMDQADLHHIIISAQDNKKILSNIFKMVKRNVLVQEFVQHYDKHAESWMMLDRHSIGSIVTNLVKEENPKMPHEFCFQHLFIPELAEVMILALDNDDLTVAEFLIQNMTLLDVCSVTKIIRDKLGKVRLIDSLSMEKIHMLIDEAMENHKTESLDLVLPLLKRATLKQLLNPKNMDEEKRKIATCAMNHLKAEMGALFQCFMGDLGNFKGHAQFMLDGLTNANLAKLLKEIQDDEIMMAFVFQHVLSKDNADDRIMETAR